MDRKATMAKTKPIQKIEDTFELAEKLLKQRKKTKQRVQKYRQKQKENKNVRTKR